jgi:hypothetical protein
LTIPEERPRIQIKKLELPARTQDQDTHISNTKNDIKQQNEQKTAVKAEIDQNSQIKRYIRPKIEENSDPEVTPSNDKPLFF